MHLITLAGLVTIEKIQLAIDLAQYYSQAGQRVTVLDNIARLRIDPVYLSGETLLRMPGDAVGALAGLLPTLAADVVLFAASESAEPEALFTALAELDPSIQTTTLALLDLRTCDCFPHLRQTLEQHADYVIHMPYSLEGLKCLPKLGL